MLKNKVGPLVLVFGVASCICACGSNDKTGNTGGATGGASTTGGVLATGGTSATGGASAAGGSATTGGAKSSGGVSAAGGSAATGGASASGGVSAAGGSTGTSTMTLAEACAKNCALAYGLDTCATTAAVCEQSCMKTLDNTSAVNPDLGRMYKLMMICVANDPFFSTSAGFTCAKPERALNKWSPVVNLPDSPCNGEICDWNCADGTLGNFDPWVDIQCACSSI
jgi:hypothetical protein